ncbi:acyltransferase family protein [Aquabacterium sp. A3]|uniref:acyltransferase family protein n=1 Tax=Aquabacterium sp. A3 TaxID=3132829 RepID=UPI00311949A9
MRLAHIDVARGLCILLVVVGHNQTLTAPDSLVNTLLAAFRMPLLFFIAGTFFKPDAPLPALALEKAHALLKPFLVMALLHAPFRILWWNADPGEYALGILSGSGSYLPWIYALWFLPHLWLVFIAAWGIDKLFQRHRLKQAEKLLVLGALLMGGSLMLPVFWMRPIQILDMPLMLKGLPLSADLLPISLFYFFAGHLFRDLFHRAAWRWPTLALAGVVFAGIFALYNPRTGLFSRLYTDLLACTATAFAGIVLITQLSCLLSTWRPARLYLARCGVDSLFILLFHSPIQSMTQKILIWSGWPASAMSGWAAFCVSVMASLALARAIRRTHLLAWVFLPPRQIKPRMRPAQPDIGSDAPPQVSEQTKRVA